MNRRKVLIALATAAASAVAVAFSKNARGDTCTNKNAKLDDFSALEQTAALDALYAQSPVTLVGDVPHGRIDGFVSFFSPANLQRIAASGKKAVFLEIPEILQPALDAAAHGNLGPLQLAERMTTPWLSPRENGALAQTIWRGVRMLAMNGVRVHGADPLFRQLTTAQIRTYNDHFSGIKAAPAYELDAIFAARLDDTLLLENISRLANDKPHVVFYGYDHFGKREKSLRSLLTGKVDYTHLDIYSDRRAFEARDPCRARADFVHVIEEKKIYPTGEKSLRAVTAQDQNFVLR